MKYELVTIAEYSVAAAHSCSTKLFLLNLKFWKKKEESKFLCGKFTERNTTVIDIFLEIHQSF